MPATAAQVFGPVTVDPGFNSTGEKTLLTMNTTLPAGGKNVIIVAYFNNSISLTTPAKGTFRIKKGVTILYETPITNEYLEWVTHEPRMFIAVDDNPAGNDTYAFTINIAGAGSATTTVHVQGIVIKADDASFAKTTALVSVASGGTASVLSLSTAFPANSKVVVLAFAVGNWSTTSGNNVLIGAGNIRLKLGTTIVSSNQFSIGAYGLYSGAIFTLHASLPYFTTVTTSSQTWSIEIYNNSTQTFSFYAGIVAFTVFDGAFLDTAAVGLSNGVQVLVGNLTTNLTGDVVAIGIGSAENTSNSMLTAFNAGDVVLQKDNLATGQVSLGVNWNLAKNNEWNRSGMLALFRLDTGVTNPSYQIKMTARASGINGEAKILAFSLGVIVTVTVTDSGTGVEEATVTATASTTDSATGAEVVDVVGSIPVDDAGSGTEVADLSATVFADDAGTGVEFVTAGIFQFVDDIGSGTDAVTMVAKEVLDTGAVVELVDMTKEALDSGTGVETIESPVFQQLSDSGAGVEIPVIAVPQSDVGAGVDVVDMVKEVLDTGAGIDAVLFLSKEVIDTGTAVELPTVITSIPVLDSGTGFDAIGITVTIHVFDTGTGVEEATRTLSMFGDVTIDEIEIIGLHSIPYTDFVQDRLPIQVQRNAATDFVYIDSEQIGDVLVEWEDRVADVYRGRRTITVMGLVKVVD
jgi:hypothetical protein